MKIAPVSADLVIKLALGGAALFAVVYVVRQAAATSAGMLTGDNWLTNNATNANGEPVNAYQNAGPVGTLGAAANMASGGILASVGAWIGGAVFDLTNPPRAMETTPLPMTLPQAHTADDYSSDTALYFAP